MFIFYYLSDVFRASLQHICVSGFSSLDDKFMSGAVVFECQLTVKLLDC